MSLVEVVERLVVAVGGEGRPKDVFDRIRDCGDDMAMMDEAQRSRDVKVDGSRARSEGERA